MRIEEVVEAFLELGGCLGVRKLLHANGERLDAAGKILGRARPAGLPARR